MLAERQPPGQGRHDRNARRRARGSPGGCRRGDDGQDHRDGDRPPGQVRQGDAVLDHALQPRRVADPREEADAAPMSVPMTPTASRSVTITPDGGSADTLNGGEGNDTLVGGIGAETLTAETAMTSSTATRAPTWRSWGGPRPFTGIRATPATPRGPGRARPHGFNGSNVAEQFDVSANGGRVRFSRDSGPSRWTSSAWRRSTPTRWAAPTS